MVIVLNTMAGYWLDINAFVSSAILSFLKTLNSQKESNFGFQRGKRFWQSSLSQGALRGPDSNTVKDPGM